MKSDISYVGKMNGYILLGDKKGMVIHFCDMEVLYRHKKYNFSRQLAFLTQLTLIESSINFHFILILDTGGNSR